MRSISCEGTPYEIGLQHGQNATQEIQGSLKFYRGFLKKQCALDWPEVCNVAVKFAPLLEGSFPEYMQEIRGIAEGAGIDVESILALNVRTEIAYGMFSDGCTALSWKDGTESFLAQNWDWDTAQGPNLIAIHIRQTQPLKPTIHMVTEAGIIGKIGLNSAGVGVSLNAIKAVGVNFNKLPCHLALRTVLNSSSKAEAMETLKNSGVAAACHILIADATSGGTGLECSANDIVYLHMNDEVEKCRNVITHTNHFVHKHGDLESILFWQDSVPRLDRVRELLAKKTSAKPSFEGIEEVLMDEQGFPVSICRNITEDDPAVTLFSIVMDLNAKRAKVRVGRPVAPTGVLELKP